MYSKQSQFKVDVYLDFQKAFDQIDYSIILTRLDQIGENVYHS